MKTNELAKWFNAALEAWNTGTAPWVYDSNGRPYCAEVWCRAAARFGNDVADEIVVMCLKERGIRRR